MKHDPYFLALLDLCFTQEAPEASASTVDQAIQQDVLTDGQLRILPLLYCRSDQLLFSQSSWTKIEGIYKHTFYRNRLLIERAAQMQQRLVAHFDGPVIVLKGMCAALSLYVDLGCRPMNDIDFWVPEFDYPSGKLPNHFDSHYSVLLNTVRSITLIDHNHFQYDLQRKLHDHATELAVEQVCLQDITPLKFQQHEFSSLCPEHLLLHTIYHGILSGHFMEGYAFLDCIMLLQKYALRAPVIQSLIEVLDLPGVINLGFRQLLEFPSLLGANQTSLETCLATLSAHQPFKKQLILHAELSAFDQTKPLVYRYALIAFIHFLYFPWRWRHWVSQKDYWANTHMIQRAIMRLTRRVPKVSRKC